MKTSQVGKRNGRKAAAGKRGKKEALRPAEVELLRSMFDEGMWSVETLAKKFGLSAARVRGLVQYKTDC